jgi:dihydrolipoamide dehydrogenase
VYDIIFIGGGLNYAGAVTAAKNGLKVALIERDLDSLGGVCLHRGCIPSKTFLHRAETIRQSRHKSFQGTITLDMKLLQEEKHRMIEAATKAITKQCAKVDLIEGEGVVTAPHTVRVGDKKLEGKEIVIGTGSSPFIPDGIEYDKESIITSDEVLELEELPENIAIYGDGAIGLEMASFFAASGVKTTLISRHAGRLKRAHAFIAEALEKMLQKEGITHLVNHPIAKAKSTSRGVHITFEDGSSRYFEKLLVAAGRRPNIDVIATDAIEKERGIVTDEHFETTLAHHYAVGDCNGKLQLAHAARAEVLYVVDRIVGKKPKMINLDHVVKFIHTLPMCYATVGQNRNMLEKRGVAFKESIVPLSHFTLSSVYDAVDGAVILYADEEAFIVGAEILSPYAEELITSVAMALAGEMDIGLAKKTIFAHPTFSEAVERSYFRL